MKFWVRKLLIRKILMFFGRKRSLPATFLSTNGWLISTTESPTSGIRLLLVLMKRAVVIKEPPTFRMQGLLVLKQLSLVLRKPTGVLSFVAGVLRPADLFAIGAVLLKISGDEVLSIVDGLISMSQM